MGSELPKLAVMKDAPTMFRKEEYVGDMEQSLPVKNEYSGRKDTHTIIKTKGLFLLYTWGNRAT